MPTRLRVTLVLALVTAFASTTACGPSEPPGAAAVTVPPFDPSAFAGPVSALPDAGPSATSPEVQLGKRLFAETRLSANGEIACASCHDVANGGDDGRRYSIGADGDPTAYNTPTVLNSGLNFAQFWDGRARTLEEQIRMTLSSDEMGFGPEAAVAVLSRDHDLVAAFDRVYDDGLTPENLVAAVAAYLRALTTPGAPFDRYLNGDESAIDAQAREGYRLFTSLGCVSCHQGRNLGGNLFQHFGVMGDYFADRGGVTEADLGRYNVTGREQDRFKFKVPSLRNVAETAPYFHDGSVATLDEAVRTMLEYQLARPPSEEKVAALAAFLATLSAEVEASLR